MVRDRAMEEALSGRIQDGGRTQLLQRHGAEAGNVSLLLPSNPAHYQTQEEVSGQRAWQHSPEGVRLLGHKTWQKRADHASEWKASKEQPAGKRT